VEERKVVLLVELDVEADGTERPGSDILVIRGCHTGTRKDQMNRGTSAFDICELEYMQVVQVIGLSPTSTKY
jgi:hypothetical protein